MFQFEYLNWEGMD